MILFEISTKSFKFTFGNLDQLVTYKLMLSIILFLHSFEKKHRLWRELNLFWSENTSNLTIFIDFRIDFKAKYL